MWEHCGTGPLPNWMDSPRHESHWLIERHVLYSATVIRLKLKLRQGKTWNIGNAVHTDKGAPLAKVSHTLNHSAMEAVEKNNS